MRYATSTMPIRPVMTSVVRSTLPSWVWRPGFMALLVANDDPGGTHVLRVERVSRQTPGTFPLHLHQRARSGFVGGRKLVGTRCGQAGAGAMDQFPASD